MVYYRVYSLDAGDSHYVDVQHFEADCDAAAILKVEATAQGVTRELWNQARKVREFAPRACPPRAPEPANGMDGLIDARPRWRWNPLGDPCQAVATKPLRRAAGRGPTNGRRDPLAWLEWQ